MKPFFGNHYCKRRTTPEGEDQVQPFDPASY
jgi:hypothetical protein